jgi:hypothetical protein
VLLRGVEAEATVLKSESPAEVAALSMSRLNLIVNSCPLGNMVPPTVGVKETISVAL